MHRLIVTSATYRQSSRQTTEALERDPRNLWLARQNRLRLEAEIVRDAALSASGLLDSTLGGPSVHPPQPDGVYAFTQLAKQWKTDTGPARYRRALYTFFYRSAPYPLFTTFDAPDFQTSCTRRPRSNTPLQSLTVANDAAFVELAQGLALRLAQDLPQSAATDPAQLLAARVSPGVAFDFKPRADAGGARIAARLCGPAARCLCRESGRRRVAGYSPACRHRRTGRRRGAGLPGPGAAEHRQLYYPRMTQRDFASSLIL